MLEGKVVSVSQVPAGSPIELNGSVAEAFAKEYPLAPPRIGRVLSLMNAWSNNTKFLCIDALRGRSFERRTAMIGADDTVLVLDGKAADTVNKAYRTYVQRTVGPAVGGVLNMTIGSDPEIFAVDETGTLIPAFEFLPDEEHGILYDTPEHGNAGKVYWDGFQAELAPKYSGCLEYHTDRIRYGLEAINNALKAKFPKGRLTIQNVLAVPQKWLAPEVEERFVQLGCSPSLNVWGMNGTTVADGRMLPMRFAGGHWHLGLQQCNFKEPTFYEPVTWALDAIAGVAGVSMAADIDRQVRREYYGLPGEIRLPAHGQEYRSLSNFWLTHPVITHFTGDLVREAARLGHSGFAKDVWIAEQDEVHRVMMEHDVQGARAILKRNQRVLKSLLEYRYKKLAGAVEESTIKFGLQLLYEGIGSIVAEPDNIEKNWRFGQKWKKCCGDPGCKWINSMQLLENGTLL